MVLATGTITGKFLRPDGVTPLLLRARVTAVAANGTIKSTDGVIASDYEFESALDGTLTVVLPLLPQTGVLPAEAHWSITFTHLRGTNGRNFGPPVKGIEFNLTASTTWDAVVDVSGVPLTETLLAQFTAIQTAAETARTGAEAARAGAEAVGTTNDTVIASRVNDTASATAVAIAARIAVKTKDLTIRSFFAATDGGERAAYHDFTTTPNIANFAQGTEGLPLHSGHATSSAGSVASNSIATVVNGFLTWTDVTSFGATPIRTLQFVLDRTPETMGMLFVMDPETTTVSFDPTAVTSAHPGANAVIGCGAAGFGDGSLQMAMYKGGVVVFTPENPIVDPYPNIGSFVYDNGAQIKDDGATLHGGYLVPIGGNQAVIYCPGLLAPRVLTHVNIGKYVGRQVGLQVRRSASTDGTMRFAGLTTSHAPADQRVPAGLTLPGTQTTFVQSNPPEGYVPDSPQVEVWASPTGGWANGSVTNIGFGFWKLANSHLSFADGTQSNGKPIMYVSSDGVTPLSAQCSTFMPAGATGYRQKYDRATGNVLFYTTSDPITATTPTWTELGTVGGTNVLTAGTALYAPPRRTPFTVGTRDDSSALMFNGTISRVVLTDGTATIADCDLRRHRGSRRWTDPQGNRWVILGIGAWAWKLDGLVPSYVTTKGDLLAGTGPGAVSRLGVGIDGTVLTADSTSATGSKWAPSAGPSVSRLASTVTVSNTTTKTTLWTPPTIGAGSLTAGVTGFRIRLTGSMDQVAASGGITGKLDAGATTILTWTISASTTGAQSGKVWQIDFDVVVDTTGASGQVSVLGQATSLSTSGITTQVPYDVATTVDLSGGLALKVAEVMGVANAGNIIRADRGVLQQIS